MTAEAQPVLLLPLPRGVVAACPPFSAGEGGCGVSFSLPHGDYRGFASPLNWGNSCGIAASVYQEDGGSATSSFRWGEGTNNRGRSPSPPPGGPPAAPFTPSDWRMAVVLPLLSVHCTSVVPILPGARLPHQLRCLLPSPRSHLRYPLLCPSGPRLRQWRRLRPVDGWDNNLSLGPAHHRGAASFFCSVHGCGGCAVSFVRAAHSCSDVSSLHPAPSSVYLGHDRDVASFFCPAHHCGNKETLGGRDDYKDNYEETPGRRDGDKETLGCRDNDVEMPGCNDSCKETPGCLVFSIIFAVFVVNDISAMII